MSSLTIHNIADANGRDRAITEAYRVLVPGGRLLIADFQHGQDYAVALRRVGAEEVAVSDLGCAFGMGGRGLTRGW